MRQVGFESCRVLSSWPVLLLLARAPRLRLPIRCTGRDGTKNGQGLGTSNCRSPHTAYEDKNTPPLCTQTRNLGAVAQDAGVMCRSTVEVSSTHAERETTANLQTGPVEAEDGHATAPAPLISETTTTTTTTEAMPPQPGLILILAATPSLGIGMNGGLPWPMLRKEMAYFARVTRRVGGSSSSSNAGSTTQPPINAVIMGRKTWDSIPTTFRPLKDRLNLVVTRDVPGFTRRLAASSASPRSRGQNEGPISHPSLHSALAHLYTPSAPCSPPTPLIHKTFLIGGASLYTAALALPCTTHILLTKIHAEFACDTYLSEDVEKSALWRRAGRREFEDFVGEEVGEGEGEVVEEGGVRFEFCLFVRR